MSSRGQRGGSAASFPLKPPARLLASRGGGMHGFVIHAAFDVLAWLAAAAAAVWVARTGRVTFPLPEPLRLSYLAVLLAGAGIGAFLFGTANLWLSGQSGFARFPKDSHGPFAGDQRLVIRADDDPTSLAEGVKNKFCGRDAHRADRGGGIA